MEIYKVSGNESTPDICLDQKRGIFIFNGRSLPENATSIYAPVISWFEEYIKNPNDETLLDIRFEYINSSSIKQLAKLLVMLENIITKGCKLQVRWHFEAEDFDTKAYGEHLSKLVSYPIVLVSDQAK